MLEMRKRSGVFGSCKERFSWRHDGGAEPLDMRRTELPPKAIVISKLRPCLGPWPYHSRVSMSVAYVTTKGGKKAVRVNPAC